MDDSLRGIRNTDIKRKATEIIAGLQRDQETLVITEHGREAAVLMDVISYRMQERKPALLEGLIRGQRDLADGRTPASKASLRSRTWDAGCLNSARVSTGKSW